MKSEADEENNVSQPECAGEHYLLKSNKGVRQIWKLYYFRSFISSRTFLIASAAAS